MTYTRYSMYAVARNKTFYTGGRVRAEPSFQLGTVNARTKWWRATRYGLVYCCCCVDLFIARTDTTYQPDSQPK